MSYSMLNISHLSFEMRQFNYSFSWALFNVVAAALLGCTISSHTKSISEVLFFVQQHQETR